MQNSRFNTRKRFNNQKEDPIPPKLPNKRIVFEDEDLPAEASQPEKPENKDEPFKSGFMLREIAPKSSFWRRLQIKGPTVITVHLTPSIIANRALYYLMRELGEQLYRNFESYQQNELAALMENRKPMSVEQIMDCLKEMNEKTMKYEKKNFSVYFFTENVIHSIRSLLMGAPAPIKLLFDDFSALLEQLRSICKERKLSVTESELVDSRNALARCLCIAQSDFVACLPARGRSGLQSKDIVTSDVFKSRSDALTLIRMSPLGKLDIRELKRTAKGLSLWTEICCSERAHLLEIIFPFGLLECLPENVKEFLRNWMEKVQKRMRKRWENGDLKKVVDVLLASEGDEESRDIQLDAPVIGEFLRKICDNVLNCNAQFQVFDEQWMDLLGDTMSHLTHTNFLGNKTWHLEKCFDSFGFKHLASILPNPMLRHVKTQLVHFFLKFCYHTIRFVFYLDIRERRFSYDGSLEFEDVPEFRRVEVPKQQVIRPRKTLLPTPMVQNNGAGFLNQNQHLHLNQNPPTYPVRPFEKISFFPIHPSPIYTPPTPFPIQKEHTGSILSHEVTEEELKSARALRPPSEGSTSLQMEEDEGVPKKWRDAYRLLLEWNQELMGQLNSVKDRFHKFC